VMAVWEALVDYPFLPEIFEAKSITLHRRDKLSQYYSGITGGETRSYDDNPGVYDVTIYNAAYLMLPNGNGISSQPSFANFRGVIAHEMTHVAINTTPTIVQSYEDNQNLSSFFSPLGTMVNWAIVSDQTSERIALAAGVWEVDPYLFTTEWLSVSITNFSYEWIASYAYRNFCSIPVP
jgi:hypothetical protein